MLRLPADATMPQALVWAACPYPGVPPALQCATLTVPVDYSHPGRGSTHVVIDRLPAADPAHRLGSLVVDPGGPGSSGTEMVGQQALGGSRALFTHGVHDDYDLIGFDPRGVGVGRADAELPRSLLRHRDRGALRCVVPAPRRANGARRQP
jgi:pimeloyl-ACP methyl ester carboxylesterase